MLAPRTQAGEYEDDLGLRIGVIWRLTHAADTGHDPASHILVQCHDSVEGLYAEGYGRDEGEGKGARPCYLMTGRAGLCHDVPLRRKIEISLGGQAGIGE